MTTSEAKQAHVKEHEARDHVCFGVAKQNSGRAIQPQWYRRQPEDGVLLPVELDKQSASVAPLRSGRSVGAVVSVRLDADDQGGLFDETE
jgi:hypothetical protein